MNRQNDPVMVSYMFRLVQSGPDTDSLVYLQPWGLCEIFDNTKDAENDHISVEYVTPHRASRMQHVDPVSMSQHYRRSRIRSSSGPRVGPA
jgi:hypothetical protein